MEGGTVGFSDIIEKQLQLKGMRRSLPRNTHKENVRTKSVSMYPEGITAIEVYNNTRVGSITI